MGAAQEMAKKRKKKKKKKKKKFQIWFQVKQT